MKNTSLPEQIIASIAEGTPINLVNSPPGAGKSHLIVDLVERLVSTPLSIGIIAPTRQGVTDLAMKIHERLGTDGNSPRIHAHLSNSPDIEPFSLKSAPVDGAPYLTTVASMSRKVAKVDLLIIDEAYQSTFASICQAADNATQLLMVGDPGQIGPVVRSDVKLYSRQKFTPAGRAPEVFVNAFGSAEGFVRTFSLRSSYRLGEETVKAIAPLYDFSFDSKRPDRYVRSKGERLPEIVPFLVGAVTRPDDETMMNGVVEDIRDRLEDGKFIENESARGLRQEDIAVVVSHNVQEILVGSLLNMYGLTSVTVGTADSLQGAQWPLVYSLDPMLGHEVANAHQLSPGRLLVNSYQKIRTGILVQYTKIREGQFE